MGLTAERNGGGRSLVPGTFIDKVKIKSIKAYYNQVPDRASNWKDPQPADIGLIMYLDIGKDFEPVFEIFGNFGRNKDTGEIRRDEQGNVDAWGGAFPIQIFLNAMGYTGPLGPNGEIPEELLKELPGREFYRLTYATNRTKDNGTPWYNDFNIVGSVEAGPEALAQEFLKQNSKGYPKNYAPPGLMQSVPANTESVI